MASSKKIIVVVGATGNQGSSVVHTFLKLPNWHVRCVTRNPSSSAGQGLAALGAEVIQADMSEPSFLFQAFMDANAIFINTDFWETYGKTKNSGLAFDQEVSHGKNAAMAAAKVPSLERLIYSALGPMKKHSKGKYPHSYHWDSKDTVVEYIENEQPELAKKTAFICLGAYSTNPFLTPRFDPASGKYTFIVPWKKEERLPIIDPTLSTGPFVRVLVEDEDAGTKLLAYDSYLSFGDIVDLWSKATGKEAVFVEVSVETMHQQFGIPMEVLDAPGFIREFGYMGGVEGFIEPFQFKKKVLTKSFEEWQKGQDWEEVLDGVQFQSQK